MERSSGGAEMRKSSVSRVPVSAEAVDEDGRRASPEEWRAAGRAMLVQYRRALLILEEYDRSGGSLESVLASLSDRS